LTQKIIAIDAMGGDHGIKATVPAVVRALRAHKDLSIKLVGDESQLTSELSKHKFTSHDRCDIIHATEVVGMDEPVAIALRNKKDSSMRRAIELVKTGEASACVSSGNTGALMATAKYLLKTLHGVSRPAIMTTLPTTSERDVRVLDLGANIDASAEQLLQFALMGSIATSAIEGLKNPRVALLNVGEEQIKGNEQVKAADLLLRRVSNINYIGYIEGNAIFNGQADVVVCDGFVGNVALKASEGVAKLVGQYAKEEFSRNWYSKIVAAMSYPVLKRVMRRLDPRERNGASLLGLSGIVLKSHGSADDYAFFNAIGHALLEIEKQLPMLIGDTVGQILGEN
jgi:phosphate acyltransferase